MISSDGKATGVTNTPKMCRQHASQKEMQKSAWILIKLEMRKKMFSLKFLNPVWSYLTRTVKLRMAYWLAQQYHSFRQTAPLHLNTVPAALPWPHHTSSCHQMRVLVLAHKSLQQTPRHPEGRCPCKSHGISLEPPRGLRPQPRAEALGRVNQMQSVRWDEVGEPLWKITH